MWVAKQAESARHTYVPLLLSPLTPAFPPPAFRSKQLHIELLFLFYRVPLILAR